MAGLPVKTTADDIEKLTGYLRNQVGWVATQKIGAATNTKLVDGRKLEAMKFIGMASPCFITYRTVVSS